MSSLENKNPIVEKTYRFALEIIRYAESLEEARKFVLAKQVLRSGTGIGANVREAQMAETKKDFLHKITLGAKEAEETDYWLQLCRDSENYPDPGSLIERNQELIRMLHKIVKTTKLNLVSKVQ